MTEEHLISIKQIQASSDSVVTHSSVLFVSAFHVMHLLAPIAVNTGGFGLASCVMFLRMKRYQTMLGKRYLLFFPFASTLRRV
ncbi:hypothetical protein EDC04DRAFT_2627157 [Pisolithus marmoratus]|nr:hypothetical protein EDC04DRAFT_2627157 [Pisolithus marmoratus]